MSFQLTADQMTVLFRAKWQTPARDAITDADPNNIVGQAPASYDTLKRRWAHLGFRPE